MMADHNTSDDFLSKVTSTIDSLLCGGVPERLQVDDSSPEAFESLALKVNMLIDTIAEIHDFIIPLSSGELKDASINQRNLLASPFKELHSRLLHLTWQAQCISQGDYSQRVDFMGQFSESFNNMVQALDENEKALKKKISDLEKALNYIDRLEGILPICANCKSIRKANMPPTEQKSWVSVEDYFSEKTDASFTHSICPLCIKKLYPDFADDENDENDEK